MTDIPSVYEFSSDLADAIPPSPLPAGEYRAVVRSAEPHQSKTGNRSIKVSYHISPDQYPADYTDGNADGEMLTHYQGAEDTPKSRYALKRFCEMHGVVPSRSLNLIDFMGTEVMVQITHEDYQGIPQARVRPIRAA